MFEHGSFKVAFLLCGGLQLAGAVLLAVFVPPTEPKAKEDVVFSKLHILKSPRCIFMLSIALLGGSTMAVWDPSLGPYLRLTFSLSPTLIGLCFLPAGIAHAITSPIMGQVADRISRKYVFLFGFLINVFAFALVGGHLLAETKEQLWMVLLGSFLVGVGTPMSFVPTSAEIVDTMRRKGYGEFVRVAWCSWRAIEQRMRSGTDGWTNGRQPKLRVVHFWRHDAALLCSVCQFCCRGNIVFVQSRSSTNRLQGSGRKRTSYWHAKQHDIAPSVHSLCGFGKICFPSLFGVLFLHRVSNKIARFPFVGFFSDIKRV